MTLSLYCNRRNQSCWLRTLSWYAEASFLHLFWLLVRGMGPRRASTTGRRLLRWLGPRTNKQVFVKRNLAAAFPDLDQQQLEGLARKAWGNLGAVLAEYPHLRRFAMGQSPSAIVVEVDAQARPIVEGRIPAIYVTAHLGNWELAGFAITGMGIPLSAVYAPQSNPILDRMIQEKRLPLGCRFIAKKDALRRLAREVRSGRSVCILPDQRVDSGMPVPFFGRNALTTTSPAWLALKFNCPLVPLQIERTGDARYRTIFHKPIRVTGKSGDDATILRATTVINELFEDWIRRRPDQWLCMRRRWPTTACETAMTRSG